MFHHRGVLEYSGSVSVEGFVNMIGQQELDADS